MKQNWLVLREETQYRRLLLSGLISGIGDWFNTVALLQLITKLTHSATPLSLLIALKVAPYLLLGVVGGMAADRFPKKNIMILCDLASALFAASFLLVTTPDRLWIADAGTLFLVLSSIFNAPARLSSIRQLVRPEHVLPANALDQQVTGSVLMIGSILGGIAAAAWGVQTAFVINAVSFLVSALIVMTISYPANVSNAPNNAEPQQPKRETPKIPLRDVFRFIKNSRFIQLSAMYLTLWAIGGGMMQVMPTVFNDNVFHGGPFGLGVLYGAFGAGHICGGFLAPHFKKWMRPAIILGFMAEGVAYLLFSRTSDLWLGALLFAFALIGVAIGNSCNRALQMMAIPQEMQGRVFSLISTSVNTAMTLTLLGTGRLVDLLAPQTVCLLAGTLITAAALLFGLLLSRVELPNMAGTVSANR